MCEWVFLFLFSLGSAAAAAADEVTSLPEVVVQESPVPGSGFGPHSVFQMSEANRSQFESVDEVLRQVPGISVISAGGLGQQSSVFIRGANSEHTLVLIDGVELNDPSNPSGAFDFSTWDLNMIDRIEVYRGPSSLRFGSGALGGVIQIVTKSGRGKSESSAFVGAGSFETTQVGLALSRSTPTVWGRGSALRQESPGFSAADESLGFSEADGSRSLSGALKMGTQIHPDLDLEILVRGSNGRTELDYSASNLPPYFILADDPNSFVDSKHSIFALTANQKWGVNRSSRWMVSRAWLARDYQNSADELNTMSSSNSYFSQTTQVENRTQIKATSEWTWHLGATWREEWAASRYLSPTFEDELPRTSSAVAGGFVESVYQRGQFTTSLGIRQDSHSEFGPATTWALAPGYHFREAEAWLTLQLASAFKAPSLYQLYSPTTGNRELQPERGWGAELSLKKALSQGLFFTGSIFENRSADLIQFGTRYENAGQARVTGVEMSLQGRSDLLSFESSISHMDHQNIDTGQPLLRRPRQSWNFLIEREWGATFSTQLTARGSGTREDIGAVTAQPETVAGFEVLGFNLNQAVSERLKWGLKIENLADRSYQEVSGYGRPGRSFLLHLSLND